MSVLVAAAYRVLAPQQPEAELMGAFGAVALIVNLAVVIAAELVAWTGTAWPDLAVAVVIAGLFLQSSWSILRDARADLREAADHGELIPS